MTPQEREVLRMALEALENKFLFIAGDGEAIDLRAKAITAIKEALAQPEQEPVVGTKTWFEDGKVVTQYLYPSDIYTTPPQPEPEPCDMGNMCIGCSPRNADGNCPDAQQEPVACQHKRYSIDVHEQIGNCLDCGAEGRMRFIVGTPQRTWEGLSVSEINDLVENTKYKDYRGLVATTETKLKDKNT